MPLPPRFAPDGRTRNADLNVLINQLLRDDAATLDRRMPGLPVRDAGRDTTAPGRVIAQQEWLARFTSSQRWLYAVAPADPQETPKHDVDVAITVGSGDTREAWRFSIAGNSVLEIRIAQGFSTALYGPYADYLVQPSQLAPPPVAGHALDPDLLRIDDPGVDRLVQALIRRDTKALAATVAYDHNNTIPSEQCAQTHQPTIQQLDPRSVEVELTQITTQAGGVHSIITMPDGAIPPAKHLIVVSIDRGHGEWVHAALLENDGHIVGIGLAGCVIMPPLQFLVAPHDVRSTSALNPRTGNGLVDQTIDAYETRNRSAIEAAFDFFAVRCAPPRDGTGDTPVCRSDEAPGTPTPVISLASCEFYNSRSDQLSGYLDYLAAPATTLKVYAAFDIGPRSETGRFFGERLVVLMEPLQPASQYGTIALMFSDRGVRRSWFNCGPESSFARLARFGQTSAHDYLLAPPPKR